MVLLHLWVHGAGVDGAWLSGLRLGSRHALSARCVLLWRLDKSPLALGAAKVVVVAFVEGGVLGLGRHRHTADGILQRRLGRRCVSFMAFMRLMPVMSMFVGALQ